MLKVQATVKTLEDNTYSTHLFEPTSEALKTLLGGALLGAGNLRSIEICDELGRTVRQVHADTDLDVFLDVHTMKGLAK